MSWIFILLVGAIILLFFLFLIEKQRFISEQNMNIEISEKFSEIINGAVSGEKTSSSVKIPDIEIRVSCKDYRIGNAGNDFKDVIIFSPDLIRGKNLLTWSRDFEMPFRVANLLYLTSDKVRYVFVYRDEGTSKKLEEKIYKMFPDEIKEIIDVVESGELSLIEDKNNYKVRFVFFDFDEIDKDTINIIKNKIKKTRARDISILNIKPEKKYSIILNNGKLEFYKLDKIPYKKGESYYVKDEFILGAIFSENIEDYNCSVIKTFEQYRVLIEIYEKRCGKILEYYEDNYDEAGCSYIFENVLGRLDEIKEDVDEVIKGKMDKMEEVYDKVYGIFESLENYNNALKIKSCPLVY